MRPRTGEQFETSLKGNFLNGRLNAMAAVFRINDDNRVIGDPDHPLGSIAASKARNQGFELEVNGQPLPDWNVYPGTRSSPAATKTMCLISPTAPIQSTSSSSGRVIGSRKGCWPTRRLAAACSPAQSWITRGVEQGGYAIFNATVGYRFNRHLDATLALNNIFERKYYIRLPGNFYSQFGDRRNVMLTLRSTY